MESNHVHMITVLATFGGIFKLLKFLSFEKTKIK